MQIDRQRMRAPSSVTCASSTASSSAAAPLSSDAPEALSSAETRSPARAHDAQEHSEAPAAAAAAASGGTKSTASASPAARAPPLRPTLGPRSTQHYVDGSSKEAVVVPPEDRWFRVGDVVAGKVMWANNRGARVQLVAEPRILAYMPVKEGPYVIKGPTDEVDFMKTISERGAEQGCVPIGLIREFQVLKVPADMQYDGRGPLLSARLVDQDLLWGRAEQLMGACTEDHENVRVMFRDANEGGLMTRLGGLQLFLPASLLVKPSGEFLSAEQMSEQLCGTPVEVTITQVDARNRRFTASQVKAEYHNKLRQMKVGGLVTGTVRRIDKFGCFVGLDDVGRVSGLLHISNISRVRVEECTDCLSVGDKIKAVILGMDDDFSRISLSTADLEEEAGDMMKDKEWVFRNAEVQHALFLEEMKDEATQERLAHGNKIRDYSRGSSLRAPPTEEERFDFEQTTSRWAK